LPSYVEVTNLENNKKLYVRINDRGPFADDRIIDLSKRAAELLGSKQTGLARVRVKVVAPPANVTLIAPDGNIKIGKAYSAKPTPNAIVVENNNIITNQQNNAQLNNTPLNNIMGGHKSETDILHQDIENDKNTHNIIPHIPVYEESSLTNEFDDNFKGYSIKVGVFSNNDNVEKLRKDIASFGNLQVNKVNKQGKTLSEVTLNGFKTTEQVYNTIDALDKIGIKDPVVIKN
jgi:rare lipoprotein A